MLKHLLLSQKVFFCMCLGCKLAKWEKHKAFVTGIFFRATQVIPRNSDKLSLPGLVFMLLHNFFLNLRRIVVNCINFKRKISLWNLWSSSFPVKNEIKSYGCCPVYGRKSRVCLAFKTLNKLKQLFCYFKMKGSLWINISVRHNYVFV